MPTMLTLGVPSRRDPEALFSGLLIATAPDVASANAVPAHPLIGSASVPSSSIDVADAVDRHVVRLDAPPPENPPPARAYVVDATFEQLGDAVALRTGSPLVVLCVDGDAVESTSAVVSAGHHPAVDAADPEARIADFLAVIAHADQGFFAFAADSAAVLAMVAGTVAALRGDDIRTALRSPNLAALVSLHPDAAAATRDVLLGIVVPDAPAVAADLGRRIADIRDSATPTA